MSARIIPGDCTEVMATMDPESIDAIVTDPPYHLTSIVKRFGKPGSAPAKSGVTGAYKRHSTGFMGQTWDGGDMAFDPQTWALCLALLKPGGHLLAFGGTRTYHRMVCAIEDAGFEIRDQIGWLYGSGFPKSHDVGKKLPDWQGWGTALKPAWEPIALARKPLIGTVADNVSEHGTGALNIDGCRVPFRGVADELESKTKNRHREFGSGPMTNVVYGKYTKDRDDYDPPGRWPANVIHDGSTEVMAALGEPSRFFYCAKASKKDRGDGNSHPTVKPTDLMRYLCRLITPPKGTILDPFVGSGSTGKAAILEGFNFIGIEKNTEYAAIAQARVQNVMPSVEDIFAE